MMLVKIPGLGLDRERGNPTMISPECKKGQIIAREGREISLAR